jgi:hypothetical protein
MSYQEVTLTDALALLAVKTEGVPFWTDAEATNALNEALLMWNLMTGFWKDTITITTSANNFEYPLPASIVFGTRVEFNSKSLSISSVHEMDVSHPGWRTQTTNTGGNVPVEPRHWLPISIDIIAIWPADGDGGNTLTVDGVSATPQMVNGGDFLDIGNEELDVILGYALHVMALKEGGARFTSTTEYFTAFLKAAAEENDQLTHSSMFRHFTGVDQRRKERPTRGSATPYDQFGQRTP